MKNLAELGEFGLIKSFLSRLPKMSSSVLLGPGDDAAVIRSSKKKWIVTTDMLIEKIHFKKEWMSFEQIGFKALRVNISDIAAMGGIPRYALVSLGLPRSSKIEEAEQLFQGLLSAAKKSGVVIVGGDTNQSSLWIVNVTLLGETSGRVLTRQRAHVGDDIYVTGTLGDSSLGLAALQKRKKGYEKFLQRHFCPPERVEVGKKLVLNSHVHSMMDLSDGLLGDLQHILRASHVGALVKIDQIPVSKNFEQKAKALHVNPNRLKLEGGEDYELLFTMSPRVKAPDKINGVPITKIGKIMPFQHGLKLVEGNTHYKGRVSGFEHFYG